MPELTHNQSLLLYTALAIAGLVVLIARFKFHAFVALILASIFVGLCAGMRLTDVAKGFQDGVAAMLGNIAVVIGLGTILGKLLAESGGAEVVAGTLIRALGERRLHWTMMLVGFVVGLPVFFAVGLVLLFPVLLTVAREAKIPLLQLGIPMVAGLAVAHGFVPPHPGPMAAIGQLDADAGKTIFYSLIIGFPTAILAGPLIGRFLVRGERVELSSLAEQLRPRSERRSAPGFALTLFTILLPVILMMLASAADVRLPKESSVREWLDFLGSPMVAMLITILFSFYSFGFARGFNQAQVLKFSEECLAPAANILLVVGAGGGFNKVLVLSGVGEAIAGYARNATISPLLLGWLVAALIRLAAGSATVAISTAAGIMAPIAASTPGTNRELLVLAMGAGSSIFSHLSDGGFWIVKEYFNLTVPQTLKTWSVMTTIISVFGLLFVLLLSKCV